MGKLPPVTEEELKDLHDRAQDLSADLHGMQSRLERAGMNGGIKKPIELARALAQLVGSAGDAMMAVTHQPALDEMRREIQAKHGDKSST